MYFVLYFLLIVCLGMVGLVIYNGNWFVLLVNFDVGNIVLVYEGSDERWIE